MKIASLHRYPVKSMQGESLDGADMTPQGVVGDRAFGVMSLVDGTIASAKNPKRWAALLQLSARFVDEPRAGETPGPVEITFPDGRRLRSTDPEVDASLSAHLQHQVTLVQAPLDEAKLEMVWADIDGLAPAEWVTTDNVGQVDGENLSRSSFGAENAPDSLFDMGLVHVVTTGTLRRLAELAPESSFDARRYRPNVVVETSEVGFVENDWVGRSVVLGGARSEVHMRTMRCVMTTLAQGDLEADRGTLRTIVKHNRVEIEGMGVWACAGIYVNPVGSSRLTVGDGVSVD